MPSFCTKCGKAIGDKIAFCVGCGAKLQADGPAVQPASVGGTSQAAPENAVLPTPRGSAGKVLALTVGGIVALGGLAVGGVIYAGYRASGKANPTQQENSLGSLIKAVTSTAGAGSASEPTHTTASERAACSLISKEEVTAATGVGVSEAMTNDDKDVCTYEPGDDSAVTVVVDVKWNDGNLAMRALPGFSKQLGQEDIRHPVHGIGDEAYLLGVDEDTQKGLDRASQAVKGLSSFATGPLTFRKGEVWVAVTATMAENKGEVEKKIASIIAGRI